ncbi:TPA: hypothetical protein QDA99_002762, partial [Burkholderia vietnamiensis]|nr:hypothetical protein [Burkholderia vietnamiensis]
DAAATCGARATSAGADAAPATAGTTAPADAPDATGIGAADSAAVCNAPNSAADSMNNDAAGLMLGPASFRTSGDPARRDRRAQSSYARKCTSPLLPLNNLSGLNSFI